ncbi:nuclear transport factor 2 family protein [Orrella sp. NBD-18]|uniref:Nuclear transport factor 2 family protein n=1 Tax=Sheuella amnicola TaxID=2707330 RepID=A0A6B2QXA5_9BURK|nr:nuclear transport factor 2 family protein [Sheuella amnicola]NDY81769.1 nuclear transport factor 2 family protein [Sheuella amnicola]
MNLTHQAIEHAVQNLIEFFELLDPDNLKNLANIYSQEAKFKDPFNDVLGVKGIESIFTHMFETLDSPRFIVTERIVQDRQCFLVWEFRFRFKRFDTESMQTIHGGSHLKFNADGKVTLHRDYWDAAEELYEKLPMVRVLMRWLKRRASS